MTDDDKPPPPISLAVERGKRERDFRQERVDLTKELVEINMAPEQIPAFVQRVMEIEWIIFKSALMLQYHGLDQDAQAVVELAKIMVSKK